MNFQETQMPYKKVAIEFATFLVNQEYKKAFLMLSRKEQKAYTKGLLQKNMEDMVSYFYNPRKIWVAVDFVEEEGAIDDKVIYLPIEENGNGEAITVDIIEEENRLLIDVIEWGRP